MRRFLRQRKLKQSTASPIPVQIQYEPEKSFIRQFAADVVTSGSYDTWSQLPKAFDAKLDKYSQT